MKTIQEAYPDRKIFLCQEGTGGRRTWWYNDNFLHTISEILLRGSKSQSDLYIFCPSTGKNLSISLEEQRAHAKICRKNIHASLNYMQSIATALGIEWHSLFTVWTQLKVSGNPSWETYNSIQKQWKEYVNSQTTLA